jgi:Na+/proline symporter
MDFFVSASMASVALPPIGAYLLGRKGLLLSLWAVIGIGLAHAAFALSLENSEDGLIGIAFAAMSCVAGLLSVIVAGLVMMWVQRRTDRKLIRRMK